MRNPKLIWQLFPFHILILLGAMLAIAWYGSQSLRVFYEDQTAAHLEAQSRLIEQPVSEMVRAGRVEDLRNLCREVAGKTGTRLTVIDSDGVVLSDTAHAPDRMENHGLRPEIVEAYAGRVGITKRYSATTRQDVLYVATPISNMGKVEGALRNSIPLTAIDRALQGLFFRIALGIVFISVFAAFMTLMVSRKVSRPLEVMRQGAFRFANGDFSRKLTVSGSEEVAQLARAMNKMAAQLDDRIRAVVSQRNEFKTVLSSMVEGVIAVDPEERVLYMNKAAARQLAVDERGVQKKNILEVVRNIDLLRFIQQTLTSDESTEGTLLFSRGREDERILQVHGAQLSDAVKKRIGALIVINDVTRILRLENMRRDFVANVSHELKTPITSIKGYVETLLEEAEDGPAHVRDFLEIIRNQSDRLQAIVEDLLILSKIEQDEEHEEIALERGEIKNVLLGAMEVCSAKALEKNITVTMHCPGGLFAVINSPLLEQAVVNLIDNAVKYGDHGSAVTVAAEKADNEIRIRVADQGPGIDQEHLPRLFERFYIVDKARSRKLGGTGLGLSIVKHIARAHGGRVEVESTPGTGSIFTMVLPVVDRE